MSENIEYDSVERLREWLSFKGLTCGGFSKSIGKDPSYVATMKKAPSIDAIMQIMRIYPDFPRDYVLFGEGSLEGRNDERLGMIAMQEALINELRNKLDEKEGEIKQLNGLVKVKEGIIDECMRRLSNSEFTISKMKKAMQAFIDSLCGDNPTLSDLGEK